MTLILSFSIPITIKWPWFSPLASRIEAMPLESHCSARHTHATDFLCQPRAKKRRYTELCAEATRSSDAALMTIKAYGHAGTPDTTVIATPLPPTWMSAEQYAASAGRPSHSSPHRGFCAVGSAGRPWLKRRVSPMMKSWQHHWWEALPSLISGLYRHYYCFDMLLYREHVALMLIMRWRCFLHFTISRISFTTLLSTRYQLRAQMHVVSCAL